MKKLTKEQKIQIKLATTRKGHEFWKEIEKSIQLRGYKKDKSFKLLGNWKHYRGYYESFIIYEVDGEWIRNNLSIIFGHGGHGLVHEFIPLNEIWIESYHHKNKFYQCSCKNVKKTVRVSNKFYKETIKHEIVEFLEMLKGIPYWKAHIKAIIEETNI